MVDQEFLRKRYGGYNDERLLRIISVKRHEYEKVAIGMAEQTLRQRGLHFLFEPSSGELSKKEIVLLKAEFEATLTGQEDLVKVFEDFIKKGFNPLQLFTAFTDPLPGPVTKDATADDLKILQKELDHKRKIHNMEIAACLIFPVLFLVFLCRNGNPLGIIVTILFSALMIYVYNNLSAKDKVAQLEKDLDEKKKFELHGIVRRVEKIRNAGGGRLEGVLRPGFVGEEDEYFYRMLIETETRNYEVDCILAAYRRVKEDQRCVVGVSCHSLTVLNMDNNAVI
jgi:hypothetical protein